MYRITPVAIANIQWRTYIIWAVLNFVFIFIVYFFYPETKGMTLEETDRIFVGGGPITRGAAGFGTRRVQAFADSDSEKDPKPAAEYTEKI